MTNDKARDLLTMIEVKEPKELIVNSWWGSFVKDYKEALEMAIKALGQEPTNKIVQKAYEDGKKDGYVQAKVEQESKTDVLDKIRAEIMQLDYDLESVEYDYNDFAQTEEIHMVCREEVFQLIDKYKTESEK